MIYIKSIRCPEGNFQNLITVIIVDIVGNVMEGEFMDEWFDIIKTSCECMPSLYGYSRFLTILVYIKYEIDFTVVLL